MCGAGESLTSADTCNNIILWAGVFHGRLSKQAEIETKYPADCSRRKQDMLSAGTKAPDFTLKDKDGKEVSLSSFRGQKVVLYFYPKDNTPGCTRDCLLYTSGKNRNIVKYYTKS